MPRIFVNIVLSLPGALDDGLALSKRTDFCIGNSNLLGWPRLDAPDLNARGGRLLQAAVELN
jgi:hypothetical protein